MRRTLLALAVTALTFALLLRWIDWRQVAGYLSWENAGGLSGAAAVFVAVLFLRGARVSLLLSRYAGVAHGLADGFRLATVSNFANHVLPLRLGELAFVFFSTFVFRVPVGQSAGLLLAMRVYDLVGLCMLALGALAVLPELLGPGAALVFAASTLGLGIAAARLDWFFGLAARLARTLLRSGPEARRRARLTRFLSVLEESVGFVRRPDFVLLNVGLSLAIWVVQAVFFAVLLRTFGLSVDFARVVIAASVANVAALLPLSALGTFGTLEAGWTASFVAMGMSPTDAASSGLAMHALIVMVGGVFTALFLVRLGPAVMRELVSWRQRDNELA